ncbi:hypothetical protein [Nonomuraea sp. B19D2]|uniref:hypothetical protein n=1 Tax=Nonomuraea sp. B19D2 TaxID=3159561 RepID=UPI0032DA78DC
MVLPTADVAAFDAELEAITTPTSTWPHSTVSCPAGGVSLRAAQDPAAWQPMHEKAEQIHSGSRSAGPSPAEVLALTGQF